MFLSLTPRSRTLIALLLSVPLTSLGALLTLLIAPGIVGQSALLSFQFWLLVLPIVWQRWVTRKPISIHQPKQRDWLVGLGLGFLMFGIILTTYWLFLNHWIDTADIKNRIQKVAPINPTTFQLAGTYFTLVNALIEEYFWRWFVYSRCEEIVHPKLAVPLSAVFFTIHHTIGLVLFTNWSITIVGSIAVFVAGVIWSEYYRRYRSIWGNYISHALADLALHLVAWQVFFG